MLNTKTLAFLIKMTERVLPKAYSFKCALEKLAVTGVADFDDAFVDTDYVNFYACLLAAIGAEDAADKARWVSETCAAAAMLSADADNELDAQLADSIELLTNNDRDTVFLNSMDEAAKGKMTFKGNHLHLEGLENYPTYMYSGAVRYRLENASYRKGIYVRVKDTNVIDKPPTVQQQLPLVTV